ncbi:MAG: hypothetical protein HGA27_03255 [Peptococcaceae bacterium]|nr:hypothetical protein [Peptococcaceae bacterium]
MITDYRFLYRLTNHITPQKEDCGLVCGKICCKPDKDNSLGVYLFPGEEILFLKTTQWYTIETHNPKEYDFPEEWTNPVYFIKCKEPCPREERPLACRFFPLTAHLLRDGELIIINEPAELPYKCPLIEEKIPLEEEFIDIIAKVWQILLVNPVIKRLIEFDSINREKSLAGLPEIVWNRYS